MIKNQLNNTFSTIQIQKSIYAILLDFKIVYLVKKIQILEQTKGCHVHDQV